MTKPAEADASAGLQILHGIAAQVFPGADAHHFFEQAGEIVGVLIAQGMGHLVDIAAAAAQELAGLLHFQVDVKVHGGVAGADPEGGIQGAFGDAGVVRHLFQRQILAQVAVHAANHPGHGPVQPGGVVDVLLSGVGLRQDQGQKLGQVDEIAQGVVALEGVEQLSEQEFHPPDGTAGGEAADPALVQGVQLTVVALEVDPKDAPGVLRVRPVAVGLQPGDAESLVLVQGVGPPVHLHGAAAIGAAEEDVFLRALPALPVVVSGMGK